VSIFVLQEIKEKIIIIILTLLEDSNKF